MKASWPNQGALREHPRQCCTSVKFVKGLGMETIAEAQMTWGQLQTFTMMKIIRIRNFDSYSVAKRMDIALAKTGEDDQKQDF